VTLVRCQNLKWVSFLLVFSLFLGTSPLVARASTKVIPPIATKIIKVEVTGDKVNLRAAPNTSGKILNQSNISDLEGATFLLVDATPILNNSDKSRWYKILFIPPFGPMYSNEGTRWNITQVNKLSKYDFSYAYISAKFVKEAPLDTWEKEDIAWFKQGRPPRLKIGDGLPLLKKYYPNLYKLTTTKTQMRLSKQPRHNAETFVLPKGTRLVDPYGFEWIGTDSPNQLLGYHVDLEEKQWIALVDGKNYQVIGWREFNPSFEEDFKWDDINDYDAFVKEFILDLQ
jgi:hypothetical protein